MKSLWVQSVFEKQQSFKRSWNSVTKCCEIWVKLLLLLLYCGWVIGIFGPGQSSLLDARFTWDDAKRHGDQTHTKQRLTMAQSERSANLLLC